MHSFSNHRPLALVAVVFLLLASCSSSSDTTTTTATAGSGTSTSAALTTSTTSGDASRTTTTSLDGQPGIQIVAPAPLSTHLARVDLGGGVLAAEVEFRVEVTGGADQVAEVGWESNLDGSLGTGLTLIATLTNDGSDVASHQVTATALWPSGETATATIDVVVKVGSS